MIVVEVLGRRGEVVQRVRLDRMPATIGRAWSNDVVIGDPTVDAAHARIVADESGALSIEDLGSVNGLHAGPGKARVPRVALNGVTTVRIGRTGLRLARADQPVPPAIPDLAPSGRLAALMASVPAMAAVIAIAVGLQALETWLGSYDSKTTASIPGQAIGIVGAVAVWAGIWSFIGRIRAHQFYYLQHLVLAWLAIVTLDVLDSARSYVVFLLPAWSALAGALSMAEAATVVALITAHLALVSTARRGRRVALALAIVAGIAVITMISARAAKDSEYSVVSFSTELEPLPASMVPTESVDDFVQRMDGLKQAIDKAKN